MKQYRKGECCPKCGEKSLKIRYFGEDQSVGRTERLEIMCNRCLFVWKAKPLNLDDNMRELTPKDVKIMNILDEIGKLTFTGISSGTGIVGGTVSQRLGVLVGEGRVEQNGKMYRIPKKKLEDMLKDVPETS